MKCPTEVTEAIQELIRTAILNIRIAGNAGDAKRCAIEADHVHNLPSLLGDYSDDLLRFYLDVERVSFIDQSAGRDLRTYEAQWHKLSSYLVSGK
jgi:hypothetical protein